MADKTKSYKKLITNTITFAIGSFGSKILVLLLVPLYTAALSPEQFGTADLIAQTANLLIPLFTFTIAEAALRFGLDAKIREDRAKVYSNCLSVLLCGVLLMVAVLPLISQLSFVKGYGIILFVYILASSFRQLNMTFVRSMEKVKLFAIDGIICTLTMLLLNVLFLVGLKWGIQGYLLATVLSDVISSLFLFVAAKLWRYIKFVKPNIKFIKEMLKYCVPLIPTTILWVITSVSDRFIITMFHGEAANGINAIAYKLPTLLTTVFTMFSQAWNISAITENSSSEREGFYTNVFDLNQSFMYIISAGVMLLNKPILYIWVDPKYFEAYKYSPVLTLATVFTCFSVFLGSVYMAEKKTKRSFYTSLAAGLINIVLNFALIPSFGIYGAAIATFVAYFVVFFYRLFDTTKYIQFGFSKAKILINTTFLCGMVLINALDVSAWLQYTALFVLFLGVVALNLREVLKIAGFVLQRFKKRTIK